MDAVGQESDACTVSLAGPIDGGALGENMVLVAIDDQIPLAYAACYAEPIATRCQLPTRFGEERFP